MPDPQPLPHQQATGGRGPALRLDWVQPIGLLGLSIANYLLRLVTLGIYHFWGKTEVRRRLWSAIRLDDEPLEYTGTGRELFLGFLIVFALVLLPILLGGVAVAILFGPQSPALAIYQLLLYVLIALLIGIGAYRAQRYRLSRTRWRGIRMGLVGSSWSYGWTYFWTLFLLPFTLGWATPWRATRLQRMLTDDMRFGDRPFRFTGTSGPLYGPFAILWFGVLVITIVTGLVMQLGLTNLGIAEIVAQRGQLDAATVAKLIVVVYGVLAVALLAYSVFSAFYRAAQINHFAAHTFFEGASFRASTSGAGLVWIAIGNFLIWLAGITAVAGAVALVAFGVFSSMGSLPPVALRVLAIVFVAVLATSAGLLSPIIQARTTRYLVERMEVVGEVPLAEIAQGKDQGIRRGEGLAEAFDIDAF
jgi:uncharacterized membrane protein YjgN (DUF898 family)